MTATATAAPTTVSAGVGPRRATPAVIGCIVVAVVAGALASSSFLLLIAVIAVVGALAALRWPDVATLAFAAVLYSNAVVVAVNYQGVPFAVTFIPPVLLLLPLVHHLILHRRPVIWTATTTWLAIFALGATCSVLLAADRGAAARPYVTFVTEGLVMFVLLTNVVRSWQVLRLIIVSVVLVGAGLGLMSLIANAQHRDWTSFGGFAQVSEGSVANASDWRTWQEWKASPLRASGPIGDPNFYALILSLLLPLAAYLIVTSRSRLGKLGALGALVLIGAGIVLTSSRGAAVAIAVVVTVLSVFGILPRRTLIYLFVAAFVLLTAVPSYRERLSDVVVGKGLIDTSSSQSTDASALGRYSELIAAGRVFAAHPVVGVSLGQFGSYYPRYSSDLGISVHEGARDAHNLYLGLGAEVGLVGLVSFLGIVVTLIRGLLRTRSRWRRERPDIVALAVALLASIGLLLANGVFLHIAYMRYMWFVFALAAIAVNLGRMQRPAPPPALPALAPSIERERPPSRATRVVTNASRS